MVDDLIFRLPPLAGPPNVLIFGEPDEVEAGAAYAFGSITLPAFMVLGASSATRPPRATAGGGIPLPVFMVSGATRYASAVQRPLVGKVSAGWQVAAKERASASMFHQVAQQQRASVENQWQDAAPVAGVAAPRWQDTERVGDVAAARWQAAQQLGAAVGLPHQDATRARVAASTGWQEAVRVPVSSWRVRHQEVGRIGRGAHVRWQEAVRRQTRHLERVGLADLAAHGWVVRWQAAMQPLPGKSVIVPPADDPCYVPSTTLVFKERRNPSTTLLFICERHSPPAGGETVIVPIREVYSVLNTISLVRFDTGDIIEAEGFSMRLDADSWTWQWNASVPMSALPIIRRGKGREPVDMLATVNSVDYRLAAETFGRDRRFGSGRAAVSGKGRAAILGGDYAPKLNHGSAVDSTIEQLMRKVLTINGVGIGWDVEFGLIDWQVPGGTWTFQGSYIDAILDIAKAAGAIVQPHATDAVLRVLPRYPVAPWHWDTLTPDYVLPADAIEVEGIEWKTQPDYNRVFVLGATSGGVRGDVTRAGTGGDIEAPAVVHPLMTHANAVAQRARAELSDTGQQAHVNLRLQVLPETGIILPNSMVSYDDGEKRRIGIVRSTELEAPMPAVRQTITVETHGED